MILKWIKRTESENNQLRINRKGNENKEKDTLNRRSLLNQREYRCIEDNKTAQEARRML
ncbi:hypothetical protein PBL1C_77 [Paenibacillus phage PBL1c]|uniref:Uncharacterized protein n=1 Tax=Paenibacillus phage PBL1c TaxID=2070194 RepID=A0A2I7SCC5_9CAUD|nr:hypothetical protein HWB44_gp77 [Paenibacillus phage PBL1c]AUS03544.1 hypothetical protein PBL1C_77 [Paenibacillus phage PBL1c]